MVSRRRASAAMLATVAALTVGGCSRAISGTPVAPAGAALLYTTCRDYIAMKPPARREVIAAIGDDGNKMVATNPDLWVGVAAALCTFTKPGTPVKDVIMGGMR